MIISERPQTIMLFGLNFMILYVRANIDKVFRIFEYLVVHLSIHNKCMVTVCFKLILVRSKYNVYFHFSYLTSGRINAVMFSLDFV